MVVGAVLDGAGRPICCELWPGDLTDVTSLLAVVKQLKDRFAIARVCVVADRGMISAKTIENLESAEVGMTYIFGARMHNDTTVRDEVLPSSAEFQNRHGSEGERQGTPRRFSVREQWVKRQALHRLLQRASTKGCRGSEGHRGVVEREAEKR